MKWIIFVLILFCANVNGQNSSDYLKEYHWITGSSDSLPEWVFTEQGEGRFIGISDPGLNSDIALEQALLRAWMMSQLYVGVDITLIRDFYNQTKKSFAVELSKDKFIALAALKSHTKEVKFRMTRKYISKYGECFVEVLSVDNESDTGEICKFDNINGASIIGEIMFVSNGDLRERAEIRVDWQLTYLHQKNIKNINFLLRGNNEYRVLTRSINEDKLPLMERGRYWYNDFSSTMDLSVSSCKLSDAFWCATSESMLYAIMGHDFNDFKVSNLDESFGKKVESLRRERIISSVSMCVKGVLIKDNKLYVDWQITNLK